PRHRDASMKRSRTHSKSLPLVPSQRPPASSAPGQPARQTSSPRSFLPATVAELRVLGWLPDSGTDDTGDIAGTGDTGVDFVLVTGDAYVDHPSFANAVIGRVLEAEGYRVAILAQPDWRSADAFRVFGRPRIAWLVSAGNLD